MARQPTRGHSRTGRPASTSLDEIVDVTLELGLEAFTVAAVAERLGIAEGTVYNYVRRREDLYSLAAARVVEQLDVRVDAEDWVGYVDEISRRVLDLAVRHPGLRTYFFWGPYQPSTVSVFETLIRGVQAHLPDLTEDEAFVLISRPTILSLEYMDDTFMEPAAAWLRRALLTGLDALLRAGERPPTEGRSWRSLLRFADSTP